MTAKVNKGEVHDRTSHATPEGQWIWLYSFFKLGATWEQVVNATSQLLYPYEKDLVLIGHEAGWAPGPVWMGDENSQKVKTVQLRYCRYPGPHLLVIRCRIQ